MSNAAAVSSQVVQSVLVYVPLSFMIAANTSLVQV